jgi:Spy/CpxP family protein refolding chaperone
MRPRARFTIAIAGLMLLAALPALAHPPGGGPHGRGGRGGFGPGADCGFGDGLRLERMAERLDLSAAQRDELRELFGGGLGEGADARLDLFQARRRLADQIHAESVDETAVREAAATVAAIEADLAVARARRAQELRRILTPEQLAELDEMRELHQRFGRRGPRGRSFSPPPAGE